MTSRKAGFDLPAIGFAFRRGGRVNRTPTGYRNREKYSTTRYFPRFIEKIHYGLIYRNNLVDSYGNLFDCLARTIEALEELLIMKRVRLLLNISSYLGKALKAR